MSLSSPAALALSALVWMAAVAQTPPVPQPFPKPPQPGPQTKQPAPPPRPPGQQTTRLPAGTPTEATLGLPIYPTAQFIASYDAGRGQRYYLFGSAATFDELVGYYRTVLKQKGELIFEAPATHMFDIGKFKEETMAFPPSVTIKDYTFGGSGGYLNPRPNAAPARFSTVIQIVPMPEGTE